jgi:clan AA aspartic protease
MGFTEVEIHISHASSPEKSLATKVLVDTGAILSEVPRALLTQLGVTPLGKRTLRVFGGQAIEREIGAAIIRYKEFAAAASVIFAEKDDTPVLGATALEAMGLQVDPVTKELKPVELLML